MLRTRIRLGLAALVAVFAVWLCVTAPGAHAAVPDCPTAPAAYGGSDAVVAELRDSRIDATAACVAQSARADRAHDDAVASATQLDGLTAKAAPLHDDLTALDASVKANAPTGSTDAPTTVHLADADAQFFTDNATALGGSVFMVAGLVAGVFAAGWFLRAVHR
jgi:hypothetical protein